MLDNPIYFFILLLLSIVVISFILPYIIPKNISRCCRMLTEIKKEQKAQSRQIKEIRDLLKNQHEQQ